MTKDSLKIKNLLLKNSTNTSAIKFIKIFYMLINANNDTAVVNVARTVAIVTIRG